MLRGKGDQCVCQAENKASAGGAQREVGNERGRKRGQGASHVETERPRLGDGIYFKCNGKQLVDFHQVRNMI